MSDSKITPPPWRIADHGAIMATDVDGLPVQVALVMGEGYEGLDALARRKANQRMIAAAPKMREVLSAILHAHRGLPLPLEIEVQAATVLMEADGTAAPGRLFRQRRVDLKVSIREWAAHKGSPATIWGQLERGVSTAPPTSWDLWTRELENYARCRR